jgi:hypothetical protein
MIIINYPLQNINRIENFTIIIKYHNPKIKIFLYFVQLINILTV